MWLVCNVRSDDTWWSERWQHQQQSTSYFYIFFDGFGDVCRCRINNEYELQRQSSPHLISWDTRPAASQQSAADTGHLVAQVCPNISPAQITSTITQTLHCLITNIITVLSTTWLGGWRCHGQCQIFVFSVWIECSIRGMKPKQWIYWTDYMLHSWLFL